MAHKIDVYQPDENDPVMRAVAFLAYNAWRQGVRQVGESMTLMIPPFGAGFSEDSVEDIGAWEITLRKVED